MSLRDTSRRELSPTAAAEALACADGALIQCREYWLNEVLDCAKIAASSALHVQTTQPELFDQYHCRPDYSLAGERADMGPVMRLLPWRTKRKDGTKSNLKKLVSDLRICFACGNVQAKMGTCQGCRTVSYCSRKCQQADWQAHRYLCDAIFSTENLDLSPGSAAPLFAHTFLGEFVKVRHDLRAAG